MNKKILIIQTAFLGDVILTLPLVQVLKKRYPDSSIDFICIPATSDLVKNNPLINEIIIYDKRNSGIHGLKELIKKLRDKKYDFLISPHRSFRSALISYLSKSSLSVSFDKSSLNFLYNVRVPYTTGVHEIQRNLALLGPLGINEDKIIKPDLYTSVESVRRVENMFHDYKIENSSKIISIAPGSVWFTKRYPEEKYVKLCNLLEKTNFKIFLIGGESDTKLSHYILNNSRNRNLINVTGSLSITESIELIKRSQVLIANDSAPLHIANSVGTKVISIFGSTIPEFGFFPYGKDDIIMQTHGLVCRPCTTHGRNKCPIKTFECMTKISEEDMMDNLLKLLA